MKISADICLFGFFATVINAVAGNVGPIIANKRFIAGEMRIAEHDRITSGHTYVHLGSYEKKLNVFMPVPVSQLRSIKSQLNMRLRGGSARRRKKKKQGYGLHPIIHRFFDISQS